MVDLTAQVEAASRGRSGTLRTVQVFGIVAAVLLLGAIFFYFARNMRKDEAVSNRQRKETNDILRTVNEGLFLLDKDLKLGSERSMALNNIFRREEFDRPDVRHAAERDRAGEDAAHGDGLCRAAVGRPRQREAGQDHQPAQRSRGALRQSRPAASTRTSSSSTSTA